MAAITIGCTVSNRSSYADFANTTIIFNRNPASVNGKITSLNIWVQSAMTGLKIGIFRGSGTTWQCIGYLNIGASGSGLHNYTVDINILAGDRVGMYCTGGQIEFNGTNAGYLYKSGDHTADGSQGGYSDTGGTYDSFSIGATGATTEAPPTVTTQAVSSVNQTNAIGNGNVTADGGATITERGICWKTSTGPTTGDSKATSAGTTGAFTAAMTGLSPNTLYYVRAYAINSAGTSYGSEVQVTTDALVTQALSATTSTTPKFIKGVGKNIVATTTGVTKIVKQVNKTMVSIGVVTGSVIKQISKTLESASTIIASVSATKVFEVIMDSTVSVISDIGTQIVRVYDVAMETIVSTTTLIVKQVNKNITSTTEVVSEINARKFVNVIMGALATGTGKIVRGLAKTLDTGADATAGIVKQTSKQIISIVNGTANILKNNIISRTLSGVAQVTAQMIASRAVTMAVQATANVNIDKLIGKLLAVRSNVITKIRHPFWKLKYPSHGDSEEYNVKYSKHDDTYTEKYVAHGDGEDYNIKYNNHD